LECETGENVIIVDEPSGFSEAVIDLARDQQMRAHIGLSGRRQYERRYTWKTAFAALDRNLTC